MSHCGDHVFACPYHLTAVRWFYVDSPSDSPQHGRALKINYWMCAPTPLSSGVFSELLGCVCGDIACDTVWPGSFVRPLSFSVNHASTSSFAAEERFLFFWVCVCVNTAFKGDLEKTIVSPPHVGGTWRCPVAEGNVSGVGNTLGCLWWVQRGCSRSRGVGAWRRSSVIVWWLLPLFSFSAAHHNDIIAVESGESDAVGLSDRSQAVVWMLDVGRQRHLVVEGPGSHRPVQFWGWFHQPGHLPSEDH